IPFAVPGMSHYLVAAILSAEGGIGVRSGCFCAHPYLLHMLQVESEKAVKYQDEIRRGIRSNLPGLVRVSLGCYNNESEVDHFVTLLKRIVRREYQGDYVQDPGSGAYRPKGFNPELERFFKLE
ncbi:MAG: aminotransferase class V-fold PLP-dependent enzyme, partial [Ardenticatenales bacterium]|nr:aminotransferase class V-fold PLP-dependent enzyme [Ardenticatenales bacterium]